MQARLYKDLSELANHALQDARTLKGILNLIRIRYELDSNFEFRSIRYTYPDIYYSTRFFFIHKHEFLQRKTLKDYFISISIATLI